MDWVEYFRLWNHGTVKVLLIFSRVYILDRMYVDVVIPLLAIDTLAEAECGGVPLLIPLITALYYTHHYDLLPKSDP